MASRWLRARPPDEEQDPRRDEEDDRRAEVRLQDDQPGHQARHEERREEPVQEAVEPILPPGEVARQEEDQGQLGELGRLEVQAEESDPAPRAVDLAPDTRNQDQEQEEQARQEEDRRQPLQALEIPGSWPTPWPGGRPRPRSPASSGRYIGIAEALLRPDGAGAVDHHDPDPHQEQRHAEEPAVRPRPASVWARRGGTPANLARAVWLGGLLRRPRAWRLGWHDHWESSTAQRARPPITPLAMRVHAPLAGKTSPRSSKSRNMSKLAQAGESSTVSPATAISAARATAAGSRGHLLRGAGAGQVAPDDVPRLAQEEQGLHPRLQQGRRGRKSPPLSFPPAMRITPPRYPSSDLTTAPTLVPLESFTYRTPSTSATSSRRCGSLGTDAMPLRSAHGRGSDAPPRRRRRRGCSPDCAAPGSGSRPRRRRPPAGPPRPDDQMIVPDEGPVAHRPGPAEEAEAATGSLAPTPGWADRPR